MRRLVLVLVTAVAGTVRLSGQPPAAVTAADYARAERFLAPSLAGLVVGGSVTPAWLPDDRFWYRRTLDDGAEFVLVDPARASKAPLFDHARVAAALSAAAGSRYDATHLPFSTLDVSPDGRSVSFALDGRTWSCGVDGSRCAASGAASPAPPTGRGGRGGRGGGWPVSSDGKPLALSPDGRRGVFVRDWNLWVEEVATRQERQLTTDGVKYFGYATDNAGWSTSDRAIVLWSPDSRKVATQQQDEREVGEMYLVNTTVGHPTLRISKFPLPGDPIMAMVHRVVIDVPTGKTTRLQMAPDFHRATLGDNLSM